jgi:hypothetical protein
MILGPSLTLGFEKNGKRVIYKQISAIFTQKLKKKNLFR